MGASGPQQAEHWRRPISADCVRVCRASVKSEKLMQPKWQLAASPEDYPWSSAGFYETGATPFSFLMHDRSCKRWVGRRSKSVASLVSFVGQATNKGRPPYRIT
jgi:hypothetical protein